MTKRQREAFVFIARCIAETGKAPTQIAIGRELGVTNVAAWGLVHRLHENGHIILNGRRIVDVKE